VKAMNRFSEIKTAHPTRARVGLVESLIQVAAPVTDCETLLGTIHWLLGSFEPSIDDADEQDVKQLADSR